METNRKPRVIYFDLLNITACLCVVYMHCNTIVHEYSDSSAWAQSLVVEVLCYWAVPIFFMLSGATLMNYRQKYSTAVFFRKRVERTVIPFIVFMTLAYLWKAYLVHTLEPAGSPADLISMILTNRVEVVYWFFFSLFTAYLAMPVLSRLTAPECRPTLWYMAGGAVLLTGVLLMGNQLLGLPFNRDLQMATCGSYLLYVVLGFLLSTQELRRWQRVLIYGGGVLGVVWRYVYTYVTSHRDGSTNRLLFDSLYLPAILLSVAVFVAFKNIPFDRWADKLEAHIPARRWISFISSCSFGVYLTHQFVMFYEKKLLNVDPAGWKWRVLGAPLTYLLCVIGIGILKKIPYIKKLIP